MSSYATADIAAKLRAARDAKGLSQRELSKLAGVPQSHISKIESGAVDLRVSSLIELARVLDLELALVPRNSMPAVQSVVRSAKQRPHVSPESSNALKELRRLHGALVELTPTSSTNPELAQLGREIRDLQHLPASMINLETLRESNRVLRQAKRSNNLRPLRGALSQLQNMRNDIAHRSPVVDGPDAVRPAYLLDDDEDEHG